MRGSFWQINLGHVVTIATVLVTVITMVNRLDNRTANLEKSSLEQEKHIESMDSLGTQADQRSMITSMTLATSNERRVSALESQFSTFTSSVLPKVERIDVNLQWMMKQSINAPDLQP